MKRALITGVTGQDGSYLAKLLLEKGYEVYGGVRRSAHYNLERLDYLGVTQKINFLPLELTEDANIIRVIEKVKPDEIYNLASQSFVAVSFEHPIYTAHVTALAVLKFLEAIRTINPKIKFYQASSSEQFGKAVQFPQNENTPFNPKSPYAISKTFAHQTAVNYRESYGLFICCGILFNHESPLRGLEFVTRKISYSVARIKKGIQKEIRLGNLDSKRDWGYAPEYVHAMYLMMQQEKADDYVIATGESHSVRDFAQEACSCVGLSWQDYVKVDEQLKRPSDVDYLVGDHSKARKILGWLPSTKFKDLVKIMVEAELQRLG